MDGLSFWGVYVLLFAFYYSAIDQPSFWASVFRGPGHGTRARSKRKRGTDFSS